MISIYSQLDFLSYAFEKLLKNKNGRSARRAGCGTSLFAIVNNLPKTLNKSDI